MLLLFFEKVTKLYKIYSGYNKANNYANLPFLLGQNSFANKKKNFFQLRNKVSKIKQN